MLSISGLPSCEGVAGVHTTEKKGQALVIFHKHISIILGNDGYGTVQSAKSHASCAVRMKTCNWLCKT